MENEFGCSICLDVAVDAVESNCCHNVFCEDCLKIQKTCPMCRHSNVSYSISHLSRRIIGKMQLQCTNEGCKLSIPRSEMAHHLLLCDFRILDCLWCSISFKKELFLEHILKEHSEECINNLCSQSKYKSDDTQQEQVKNDPRVAECNKNKDAVRLGASGKFYCGKKKRKCKCCDKYCGPTNGCNCEACQLLDIAKRNLPPKFLVNKAGAPSVKVSQTNHFYCGRKMTAPKLNCDGYCGPNNGPNCDACIALDENAAKLYPNILF